MTATPPLTESSKTVDIPDYSRVAIINPTAFLGNLLISGDLVRNYIDHCHRHDIRVMLVLDERFRPLVGNLFNDVATSWYPRLSIKRSNLAKQAKLFFSCLRQIRRFQPELAFNLEEDSVSSRLTQFSAAQYRLGCSPQRHRWGYEAVLPNPERPPERAHRWHAYNEVFQALGAGTNEPRYLQPEVSDQIAAVKSSLQEAGVATTARLVTVHAGATKAYKKWPIEQFSELCKELIGAGYFPLLIGAGADDERDTSEIDLALQNDGLGGYYANVCGRFDFPALAALFRLATASIGNDSGPFHLATAMGTPGVVLFGPSIQQLWGPMGNHSKILHHNELCYSHCSRHNCSLDFRCLKSITATEVFDQMNSLLDKQPTVST